MMLGGKSCMGVFGWLGVWLVVVDTEAWVVGELALGCLGGRLTGPARREQLLPLWANRVVMGHVRLSSAPCSAERGTLRHSMKRIPRRASAAAMSHPISRRYSPIHVQDGT